MSTLDIDSMRALAVIAESGGRGLRVDNGDLPAPPAIQHVARFSAGISTRQMEKLLQAIKSELVTQE